MIREGKSLAWLDSKATDPCDLAYEHRMDISGAVFTRMTELGITQETLAEMAGMDRSQISRIITGKQNITLSTLARLECALSFRLDAGFAYDASPTAQEIVTEVKAPQATRSGWGLGDRPHHGTSTRKHQGFIVHKGAAA